jgi:hypothetical protein
LNSGGAYVTQRVMDASVDTFSLPKLLRETALHIFSLPQQAGIRHTHFAQKFG